MNSVPNKCNRAEYIRHFFIVFFFYLLKQLQPLQHYYIQQNLQYATYRKRRDFNYQVFGLHWVTLTDTVENSTSTLITRQ